MAILCVLNFNDFAYFYIGVAPKICPQEFNRLNYHCFSSSVAFLVTMLTIWQIPQIRKFRLEGRNR